MPRILLTIVAVAIGLLAGCSPLQPPKAPGLSHEGFEAFATPRTFDGPGTIYRIDPDGKRFLVATIKLKTSGGAEVVPKYSSTRDLSLNQLLESIGANAAALPAKATSELSSKSSTTIEATKAFRAISSDDDVTAALSAWATSAKPRPGSTYYLVRETISTNSLSYKVNRSWLANLALDIQALKVAGYKGEGKTAGEDTLELNTQFEQMMNVWYKADLVRFSKALGAGADQYNVELGPVASRQLDL